VSSDSDEPQTQLDLALQRLGQEAQVQDGGARFSSAF
jgi:hypothetical protein